MKHLSFLFLLFLFKVAYANTIFTDSFENSPNPSSSSPQWKNLSSRVSKTDPIFSGSNFSGIIGDYFILAPTDGTSIDIPTQASVKYFLTFSYSATDTWTLPRTTLQAALVCSIDAFEGIRTEEYHGEQRTVDVLTPIDSRQLTLMLPGSSNWKISSWFEFNLVFIASSSITRITLKSLQPASASYAAVDNVTLQLAPIVPTEDASYINQLNKKIKKLTHKLNKLKQKDLKPQLKRRMITKLKKAIRAAKQLRAQQGAAANP